MEASELKKNMQKAGNGMDENAIRQWLIECFGPIQGEMAWNQLSNLPDEIREQLDRKSVV